MNNGIFPIGSITTNSAITAVIISFWKVLGILNRSWKIWKKYIVKSLFNFNYRITNFFNNVTHMEI